jgi:threonyl-tRNA synthetase
MDSEKLGHLRHTLSHLLASAVLEIYPHAKPTLGPAIDNGFYYDFDFTGGEKPGEQDLKKIEQKMREHLKKWESIQAQEVGSEEAQELFKKNPYKLELIDEILKRGEPLTLYHSTMAGGDPTPDAALFTDLCRGGHAEAPKDELANVGFKLDRIAGAYWRGDEKNAMLTRIYGLAFESKEALKEYEAMLVEAKKRDHRKLGKELDLFTFSELVGPGLPLWTPKGGIVRDELDKFVWELRKERGYTHVAIPHITKKELYEKSGHWEKFADELFRITSREDKLYALKPMNCPHHTQIFARHPHSYKDMPQRYAESTMVYRDEQSGELGGLTRVLSITQDDSHVFCRHSQVKEEFMRIWDIVDTLYTAFDFSLKVRLSFHDPEQMDNYLSTPEVWQNAENALRELTQERDIEFFEAPGEAAMYGPKLDFMATDSIGREHQVATIQLDFILPERFGLTCVNEKGEQEQIVMIHSAILGSFERFIAVMLEHLAGNLPLWLSPVQVKVVPIAAAHQAYATEVHEALLKAGIRSELDSVNDSLGKRIRACKVNKLPHFVCIGDSEVEAKSAKLEFRNGESKEVRLDELIAFLTAKIQTRSLD